MGTTDVVGKSPLTYTDSTGAQKSLPLSAFQFVDGTAQMVGAWQTQLQPTPTDLAVIAALLQAKTTAGELTAPPVTPASPVMQFAAAIAGAEGNNIAITVTASGGAATAPLTIQVVETDTYPGLVDAAAAALAIGVDNPPDLPNPPLLGLGLVQVQWAMSYPAALPKGGQLLTVSAATVVVADDNSDLFTLLPRPGYMGPPIKVSITLNLAKSAFTLVAWCDSGPVAAGTLPHIVLPSDVQYLINADVVVFQPGGGYALPSPNKVQLSGGAVGTPAKGLAYTN